MKKIKLILSAIFLVGLVTSCNSDTDDLGVQLFGDNSATGTQASYDLVAYNINNNDRVRSDSYSLVKTTLGAFTEGQFGMQKSSYVTQVRLSSYAPDFGTNPVVDSVVLEIKPEYDASTATTSTKSITHNGEAATQTLTSYSTVKYGKSSGVLTINVNEIGTDLGTTSDEIYSDKALIDGVLLGTKIFTGNTVAVSAVKTSDNTSLYTKSAGVRIHLNKNAFQSKIVAKNGATELSDETNFINYFKGIKISVQEEDGYMITFAPNDVTMTMYYTSGDASSRTSSSYSFDLGSSNVHFSKIDYKRSSTYNSVMANINSVNGNSKLYVQGMGGSGVGVKLAGTAVESLKKLYKEQGASILLAKIRLYTDTTTWNNSYTKPTGFLVKRKGSTDFITDLTTMLYNSNYSLTTAYATDSNPAYYDINITKTIKDIVEQEADSSTDLVINVGNYLTASGSLVNENYNDSSYSPYRAVLVGTDTTNENRIKLMVTYVTK